MKRALLIAAILAFGSSAAMAQLPVGMKAPEIKVGEWFNYPSAQSLEDLRGRVVFLEFWATT